MIGLLDKFRLFADWVCGHGLACGWFVSVACIMSVCSILIAAALIVTTFFDVD